MTSFNLISKDSHILKFWGGWDLDTGVWGDTIRLLSCTPDVPASLFGEGWAAQWAGSILRERTPSQCLNIQLQVPSGTGLLSVTGEGESLGRDNSLSIPVLTSWLLKLMLPSYRGDIHTWSQSRGWAVCGWSPFPVVVWVKNLQYPFFCHHCPSCEPRGCPVMTTCKI